MRSEDGEDGGGSGISRNRFYAAMSVLLLVEILGSMEQTMILSAIPVVVRQFGDVQKVGWLMTSFGLVTAATAAIGGRLGDIFGRRRLLVIVVALGGIGSLISAVASTLEWIIVGRAIQGTAGIILPLCYGIVRDLAPPGKSPFWIGLITGGYAFAAAFGYIIGGYFADAGHWQSLFFFTAATAIVSILLILLIIPLGSRQGSSGRLDIVGGVLFAPAVAAVLYGITKGPTLGWSSATPWLFIGGGLATLIFWVWYESRCKDPLIDVRLLMVGPVAVGNICSALTAIGSMQLAFILFMLLQQPVVAGVGLGVTATLAGILKLPSNATSLLGAPLGGWIATRYGTRWTVIAGGVISALSWGTLIFAHYSLTEVIIASVFCGLGNILVLVGIPNMVLEGAPKERSSEATGMVSVLRGLFSAVGSQVVALLLSLSVVVDPLSGAKLPSDHGYKLVFFAVACSSIVMLILLFSTMRKTRRPIDGQFARDEKALG